MNDSDLYYLKIISRYNAWLMSNSKWVKTLNCLAEVCDPRIDISIKTIENDKTFSIRPPRRQDVNKTRFNDGAYQPFEYKWLEWIFIPEKISVRKNVDLYYHQDVEAMYGKIQKDVKIVGELSGEGIFIYGYRKL